MPQYQKPDGSLVNVLTANDEFNAQRAGLKPVDSEALAAEQAKAAEKAEYTTPLSKAQTIAERFTLGAIPDFGLGEVFLRNTVPDYMDRMAKRVEYNQPEAMIAEGAGGVLGAYATLGAGGASTAAKAATVGAKAVSLAGGAGEKLVTKIVQKAVGKGIVGELVAKGAGVVAKGGIEGALYGVEGAVSEAALADQDLTAEQLVSHMGMGALFGGGLTAVIGGSAALAKGGIKTLEYAGEKLGSKIGNVKERAASEAYRGLEPNASNIKDLGKTPDIQKQRMNAIGSLLREEVPKADSIEEAFQKISEKQAESGERIGAMRKQFDAAGAKPSYEEFRDKSYKIIDELRANAATMEMADHVEGEFNKLSSKAFPKEHSLYPLERNIQAAETALETAESLGQRKRALKVLGRAQEEYQAAASKSYDPTTMENLWKQIHSYRKVFKDVYDIQLAPRPERSAMKALIETANEEFQRSGLAAAEAKGSDLAEKWVLENAKYSNYVLAADAASASSAESMKKPFISPESYKYHDW
jgi:hypothetical protein